MSGKGLYKVEDLHKGFPFWEQDVFTIASPGLQLSLSCFYYAVEMASLLLG